MRNRKIVAVLKQRMLAAPWFSTIETPWEDSLAKPHLWSEFVLARRNDLTAFLFKKSRRQFQKWNQVTEDVRPLVSEVLKIEAISNAHIPAAHFALLRSDILSALQEASYQDLVPEDQLFFGPLMASVYFRGLAPLGWDGDYPSGGVITRVID